jgi:hypothetical protein
MVFVVGFTPAWKLFPLVDESDGDSDRLFQCSFFWAGANPFWGTKIFLRSKSIYVIPTKVTKLLNELSPLKMPNGGVRIPLSWVKRVYRICGLFTVVRVQNEGFAKARMVVIDCSNGNHCAIIEEWKAIEKGQSERISK